MVKKSNDLTSTKAIRYFLAGFLASIQIDDLSASPSEPVSESTDPFSGMEISRDAKGHIDRSELSDARYQK